MKTKENEHENSKANKKNNTKKAGILQLPQVVPSIIKED